MEKGLVTGTSLGAYPTHARFDGRGLETEPSQATVPVPDPTQASVAEAMSE